MVIFLHLVAGLLQPKSDFMNRLFLLITFSILSMVCFAQLLAQGPMSKKRYTPKELGYKLFWEENFNGAQLDTTKWNVSYKPKNRFDTH